MTSVTDTDGFRVRWQRQFVTGTSVAEDVPAVPAVVLQTQGYNQHNCLRTQHDGEGNQTSEKLVEQTDITLRSQQAQPSPQLCSALLRSLHSPAACQGWRAALLLFCSSPSGQPLLAAELYGRRAGAWAARDSMQPPGAVPTHQKDPSTEAQSTQTSNREVRRTTAKENAAPNSSLPSTTTVFLA